MEDQNATPTPKRRHFYHVMVKNTRTSLLFISPTPVTKIKYSSFNTTICPARPRAHSLYRSSFLPNTNTRLNSKNSETSGDLHSTYPRHTIRANIDEEDTSNAENTNEQVSALEGLFLEALKAYYQGTPMFSESEFNTLRDELEHLGTTQIRLGALEKIWVQATSARDFDRHVREEFEMSQDELDNLKSKLLRSGQVKRPTRTIERISSTSKKDKQHRILLPKGRKVMKDAQKIEAGERVDERIKWLLFSEANEERLKILLLYLPAVLMSFVTASVFTLLFAMLDGEIKVYITAASRFRLGILSCMVVMLTVWFSNQVTPIMLDYLDLGQPTLMRGDCPTCGAPVSCLFTGAARSRDERKCSVCGSWVGFNRTWSKVYLVALPSTSSLQEPD